MQQYYKEQGGPTAYYGTMTAGFPNLFIMSGMFPIAYYVKHAADVLRRPEYGNGTWFGHLHGGSASQLYYADCQAHPERPGHIF